MHNSYSQGSKEDLETRLRHLTVQIREHLGYGTDNFELLLVIDGSDQVVKLELSSLILDGTLSFAEALKEKMRLLHLLPVVVTEERGEESGYDPYQHHVLVSANQVIIADPACLVPGEVYYLKPTKVVLQRSASKWTEEVMDDLRVRFVAAGSADDHTAAPPVVDTKSFPLAHTTARGRGPEEHNSSITYAGKKGYRTEGRHQAGSQHSVTVPATGADWTSQQLENLRVDLRYVAGAQDLFPRPDDSVSDKAVKLIDELKDLNFDVIRFYDGLMDGKPSEATCPGSFKRPLYKLAYAQGRGYDCGGLTLQLFVELGFMDDWLVIFPNRCLSLCCGIDTTVEAAPDLTVMNMASNLPLMALSRDLQPYGVGRNCAEARLVAEMLAIRQAHQCSSSGTRSADADRKGSADLPHVIGVRTDRLMFWFYRLEDVDHLLDCLGEQRRPGKDTRIKKLGGEWGLDFLDVQDREVIIKTLDACCRYYRALG